jgi:hypothetical protein
MLNVRPDFGSNMLFCKLGGLPHLAQGGVGTAGVSMSRSRRPFMLLRK